MWGRPDSGVARLSPDLASSLARSIDSQCSEKLFHFAGHEVLDLKRDLLGGSP